MIRALRIGSFLVVACAFGLSTAHAQKVVFVVRHAEKATGSTDPALTPEGTARANALARALKDAKVTAIYTSNTRRARETAAPLAKQLGITPVEIASGDPARTFARIRADQPEGVVLVVGHGNTVGPLIKNWAEDTSITLGEDEFDNLWIVAPASAKQATVTRLHYGH